MAELRDHYRCDGDCGCGRCCPPGVKPDPAQHIVDDGRVCGTFVFEETVEEE